MTVTTSELVYSPDTILEFHGHLNGQREATRCRLLTGKSRLPSSLLGPGVRSEISESPRPTVALIEIQIMDSSLPSVFPSPKVERNYEERRQNPQYIG